MNLGTATTLADGKLTYHKTVVCEALPGGKTRLNSGGWRTATTKKRMNQYAKIMGHRWTVKQHRGVWYVYYPTLEYEFDIKFYDGIEVEHA